MAKPNFCRDVVKVSEIGISNVLVERYSLLTAIWRLAYANRLCQDTVAIDRQSPCRQITTVRWRQYRRTENMLIFEHDIAFNVSRNFQSIG